MRIWIPLFFFLSILSVSLKAQSLNASISVSGLNYHCGQGAFTFINNSTTGSGIRYLWDFGRNPNDTISVYNTNPVSRIFTNANTYIVKLTVIRGGQTAVTSIQVTIYDPPNANFSVDTSIKCAPLIAHFTDLSTAGSSPITSWSWSFGDGSSSNLINPTYTYYNIQSYIVTLNVTDAHCSKDFSSTITVTPKPTLNVTASPLSICTPPLVVNFTNNSTGATALNYFWDFGDTSTTTNPVPPPHSYPNPGNPVITVTATDLYHCSNSQTFNASVASISASFTVVGNHGDTVCQNQYVKFNNTSGIPGRWIYGAGAPVTVDSNIFATAGPQIVKFIAGYGTACTDTAVKTIIVVAPPTAAFTITGITKWGCDTPHVAIFSNASSNAVSWLWTFNGGTPASNNNPNPGSITFHSEGNHIVNLLITSRLGCRASAKDTVIIKFPRAIPHNDTVSKVCNDHAVPFSDHSTCNSPHDQITSWHWNFGDTTAYNGQNPPDHLYNSSHHGRTTVVLTITTLLGCTSTDSIIVNIGSHQHPAFSLNRYLACAQDSIRFTNLSADTSLIENYQWIIGNPSHVPSFSPLTGYTPLLPVHPYMGNNVDTGRVLIKLIVKYNGCIDTLKDSSLIIKGPIINTSTKFLVSCDSNFTYTLAAHAQRPQYWKWNWGDSTLNIPNIDSSVVDSVKHTYLVSGDRFVRLWAVNDTTGCTYKDSIMLNVRDIIATIDKSPAFWHDTICYSPNAFKGSTYKDAVSWKWKFDDPLSGALDSTNWITTQTTHIFSNSGIYHILMLAKTNNERQCVDSIMDTVRVFKPLVNFYGIDTIGCSQTPLTTHFHSTSFSPDTVLSSWVWSAKHTLSGTDTIFGTSNDTIPVKMFPVPGRYNIKLLVTDSFGCKNSIVKNSYITSTQVNASFLSPAQVYCINEDVTFISTASSGIPTDIHPNNFTWHFGNGDSINTSHDTAVYTYLNMGTYSDTLFVSNYLGCWDTIIKPNYVQIQNIVADFNVANSDTNCYKFRIRITNNTDSTFAPMTYNWDFGDGFTSAFQTPVHWYTLPGDYYLKYDVKTSHQCHDRDSVLIHVGGPYAEIQADRDHVCKGDTIIFSLIHASGVDHVLWDFGLSGQSSTDTVVPFPFPYVPPGGKDTVRLIYTGADGCTPDPQPAPKIIYIQQVIANYNRGLLDKDTAGCQPFGGHFTDGSMGASNWLWNFGDGSTFNGQTPPTHSFLNNKQVDSTFYVTLYISDNINCKDTIIKQVIAHPTPNITISNDTIICVGDHTNLNALGGVSVKWNASSTLSNDSIRNPVASPGVTTTYNATIKSNYGCTNSDNVTVVVQQRPIVNVTRDTTIIIGQTVHLLVESNQDNATFKWSPDYNLTCTNCAIPDAQPLQTTDYIVHISDSVGCPDVQKTIRVKVDIKFSVEVPTVFTPNGDGHNDLIYVRGWGIKNINKFSIFNRWGQMLFQSNDSNIGWDGSYNGQIQPPDTYTFIVEVELYDSSTTIKSGNFNILR